MRYGALSNEINYSSIYRHKRDTTPEIYNYKNYLEGYSKLGHLKGKVPAPQFSKQLARDSKFIKRIKNRKVLTIYQVVDNSNKA